MTDSIEFYGCYISNIYFVSNFSKERQTVLRICKRIVMVIYQRFDFIYNGLVVIVFS